MREVRQAILCPAMSERDPDRPSDNSYQSTPVPAEEDPVEPTTHLSLLLASRDLLSPSPWPTETEKAVLVLKEHSYACLPQITQLAPFLHRLASSIEEKDNEHNINPATTFKATTDKLSSSPSSSPSSSKARSLLRNVRQTLSDTRRSLLIEEGGGVGEKSIVSSHFREMISLQSTLIHELQEQVQLKDAESNMILREKEQLEARLERMERRMSILQKRSRDKAEPSSGDSPLPDTPTSSRMQRVRPDSVTRLARLEASSGSPGSSRRSRSRSSSIEPITIRRSSKHSVTTPTANSLAVTSHKAHGKRDHEDEDEDLQHRSKKSRLSGEKPNSYMRTTIMYEGLDLELTPSGGSEGGHEDALSSLAPEIKVPTWSWSRSNLSKEDGVDLASVEEDTSDEAFHKRHHKLETDEKRRKRWDAQRLREQYQHKQLMKRYMQKEGMPQAQEKKKEKLTSLQPKLEDLEGIEIVETVVVSGFGRPLPKLQPSPFHLPNFNPHSAAGRGRGKTRTRSSSASVAAASSNSTCEDSSHVS